MDYSPRMTKTQQCRLDELDGLDRPLTVEETKEFEQLWQQRLGEVEIEEWGSWFY